MTVPFFRFFGIAMVRLLAHVAPRRGPHCTSPTVGWSYNRGEGWRNAQFSRPRVRLEVPEDPPEDREGVLREGEGRLVARPRGLPRRGDLGGHQEAKLRRHRPAGGPWLPQGGHARPR